mgnify:CR=1 FL=1
MTTVSIIKKCRLCKSEKLKKIINLGQQPLANSLKKKYKAIEATYSLSISICSNCKLVQLNETISKSKLFKNYIWVTGTGKDTLSYLENFFKSINKKKIINKKNLIIEIASNDGSLLKIFRKNGYKNLIGVDPALNLAKKANSEGIKTIPDFWSPKTSKLINLKYGKSKLVIARNVVPHVSQLSGVIDGIYNILDYEGVGIIEFHDASIILQELHYDSIYHEHLCYFSLSTINTLLKKHNLKAYDIEFSPVSGGSIAIYFDFGQRPQTASFKKRVKYELSNRINSTVKWNIFAKKVKKHKKEVLKFFKKNKSKKIVGFGSSARSQTFLNYINLNNENIVAIIDNNKLKQNLYSPGTNIPIVDIDYGLNFNPDYILILAWNFSKEIIKQCKIKGFKGKFIQVFPNKLKIFQ